LTDTLPEFLVSCRERLGKSRYRAAKELGVDYTTLYRWETGKVAPEFPSLARLASYYDLAPAELWDRLNQEVVTNG
jgi:transcriptional regulator with XRE-family HTH domain